MFAFDFETRGHYFENGSKVYFELFPLKNAFFFMLVRQIFLTVTQLLHVMCKLTCIQSIVGGGVGVNEQEL